MHTSLLLCWASNAPSVLDRSYRTRICSTASSSDRTARSSTVYCRRVCRSRTGLASRGGVWLEMVLLWALVRACCPFRGFREGCRTWKIVILTRVRARRMTMKRTKTEKRMRWKTMMRWIPTTKRPKPVRHFLVFAAFLYLFVFVDQDPEALKRLGPDTNVIIWPELSYDEDEEVDEVEHPINHRLMRIGIASYLISCHFSYKVL